MKKPQKNKKLKEKNVEMPNNFFFFVSENCFESNCPNALDIVFCFLFSKTILKNSLPNIFLTRKQLKTVFCFCSRKQFSKTKTETDLPNELKVFRQLFLKHFSLKKKIQLLGEFNFVFLHFFSTLCFLFSILDLHFFHIFNINSTSGIKHMHLSNVCSYSTTINYNPNRPPNEQLFF